MARVVRPPAEDLGRVLSRRHLPGLDGMRALAVGTVIAYHAGVPIPGDLGVSAFFVLSGFLITWLLLREWRANGGVSLRNFYVRRTLRIFPAYYVFIAVSFAWDRLRRDPWPAGLAAAALAYVVNYYNAMHGHPPTSIAHAWSLGVEEQFYVMWPAVFLFLVRWRAGRAMVPAVVGLVVAVLLWRSLLFLVGDASTAYVYNAFDTRFDNLGVGCLLAICVERPWFAAVARFVARRAWLPLLAAALLVWSRVGLGEAYHYSLGFTVDALLIAVLIIQVLQLHQSVLWSWLEHPVARYMGVISYPLYLYHQWGIGVGHQLSFLPTALQAVAGVLVSVALASGSYFLIECPFLALKRHFDVSPPAPLVPSFQKA